MDRGICNLGSNCVYFLYKLEPTAGEFLSLDKKGLDLYVKAHFQFLTKINYHLKSCGISE